jgi:hypothetical protein
MTPESPPVDVLIHDFGVGRRYRCRWSVVRAASRRRLPVLMVQSSWIAGGGRAAVVENGPGAEQRLSLVLPQRLAVLGAGEAVALTTELLQVAGLQTGPRQ